MSNLESMVMKVFVDAGKPMRPGDIAKQLEVSSDDVTKVVNSLKKQGKIHSPKRCFYEPTK